MSTKEIAYGDSNALDQFAAENNATFINTNGGPQGSYTVGQQYSGTVVSDSFNALSITGSNDKNYVIILLDVQLEEDDNGNSLKETVSVSRSDAGDVSKGDEVMVVCVESKGKTYLNITLIEATVPA